jgi:hypothetical protein
MKWHEWMNRRLTYLDPWPALSAADRASVLTDALGVMAPQAIDHNSDNEADYAGKY